MAEDVNNSFNSRKYCYSSKDPNFKAIYDFDREVLPRWLQCRSNHIQNVDWLIHLDQFDIFLGELVGTDGIENHSVAIYNNWIFDANEKNLFHCAKKDLIIV